MRISDWSSDVCSSDLNGEAAEAAREAIARNPRNAGFHGNLAVALKRLGRNLEAVDAFVAALALNPTAIHLHKEIGDLCMQAKSFEPAIEHYQAYMAQAADDPELHVVWNNQIGRAPCRERVCQDESSSVVAVS